MLAVGPGWTYFILKKVDIRQAAGRKKYLPNLYHNMIKNMLPTPLSGIRAGK
jgi:hypothetical protein